MQVRIQQPRIDEEGVPRFLHISWLYAQDYCDQLYLEHVKGISVDPTSALTSMPSERCHTPQMPLKVVLYPTLQAYVTKPRGSSEDHS